MSALRITLFGKLTLCQGSEPLPPLPLKAQELLCYLLLHTERPHTRDALAGHLWQDASPAQSKKYLRQALWRLQQVLDRETGLTVPPSLLMLDGEWIHLNPERSIWLDTDHLTSAFSLAHQRDEAAWDEELAQVIGEAVEVYRGDLLEGWYQDWCLYERERLQLFYLALLDHLMIHCEQQRAYERGLDYGLRSLRLDRAREATHQRLIRLYHLAGNRTAALRQYELCVSVLASELQVTPSRRTIALYEQVRSDQEAEGPPSRSRQGEEDIIPPLATLLAQLHQIQGNLAAMQQQVQQSIHAVEQALRKPP